MTDYKIKYDISSKGFLPEKCHENLSKNYSYLQYFLNIMKNNNGEHFKDIVQNYRLSEEEKEQDISKIPIEEQRYIYSICSILAHKYVWVFENDYFNDEIPFSISLPWFESSKCLGINCILTHSAINMYNWRLINPLKEFSLDNIEIINLMNGSLNDYSIHEIKESESWFYLIMVAIEGSVGPMIDNIENIYKSIESEEPNKDDIMFNLIIIRDYLRTQSLLLSRLYEKCIPDIFYNQTRKYLWGSNKNKSGWNLQGIDSPALKFDGGSASQSSLIRLQDIFFEINHDNSTNDFLVRMRDYMPIKHREYLNWCDNRPSLKKFVLDNTDLHELFNDCIDLIIEFRKKHIKIVYDYVKIPETNNKFLLEIDRESYKGNKENKEKIEKDLIMGTGGTNLFSFLSNVIKNTKKNKIIYPTMMSNILCLLFYVSLFIILYVNNNI